MSPVINAIKHYQNNIEKYGGDEKRILHCIDKLDNLPVTVQHLQDTGVGRTVNALRKDHGEIGKASKALVAKWKLMVAEEEESEEEPQELEEEDEEVEEENNSIAIRESENDQRSQSNHSDSRSQSDGKRKYNERANDNSSRSKDDSREMHVQKKSRKDSEISESVHYSSHNSCDSDGNRSDESTRNKTHELNDDSDMENKYTNYKHEKTKHKHSENGDSNKVKSSHHSRSKDRNHHRDKKSSTDSQSDKHSSRSSKDHKDRKDSKDSSKRHKQSEDKKERHSSERKNSSDKKSSSSSSKSSDSKRIKETVKPNDSKSLEKSHSSKPKEDKKESKPRDDKKSSTGSKHDGSKTESKEMKEQSSKNKSNDVKETTSKKSKSDTIKKEKRSEKLNDDGIDCESGASFAEALGMITSSPVKKKSAPIKDIPTKSSPDTKKTDIKSPSEKSETKPVMKASSSSKDTSLLHPDYKLSPLPLIEISALPEISPNYKPRPPPKLLNSMTVNEEEALTTVMHNKNIRTKVYSGNRVYGAVPTLYEMCVIILQENIDALEYTGGVPYEILKPIVDKANPDQLFMLEHYNPYLMDDTDPLWQKHCEKKFRSQRRQELETWREMYMRCLDEQEAKLKSLTANIKLSLDKKMAPARFTKMAYVDGNVKPPRGIARKQAIHGTARVAVVSPAARVASLASGQVVKSVDMRGAPSSSDSSASRSSGFIKPKKAPLMQKALQLMKGRHKR